MYKYPEKLIDQLTEWESEGAEILITQGSDSTVFIVKFEGLDKWIVVAEWHDGQDDFDLVNITGKAFKRVHNMIHEFVPKEIKCD